jgi:hypothetical protein
VRIRRPDVFVHRGQVLGAEVDWAAFPWPEPASYHRPRILAALRAVVEPRRKDWSDPVTIVEYTVGNGHAGTVYPAALAMTGQLLAVAESYPGEPRRRALRVLADWWGGYLAEPGLESFVDDSGVRIVLLPALAGRIADGADRYGRMATSDPDPEVVAVARELLTVIPLGWGHCLEDDGSVSHWGGQVQDDGTVRFPETKTETETETENGRPG